MLYDDNLLFSKTKKKKKAATNTYKFKEGTKCYFAGCNLPIIAHHIVFKSSCNKEIVEQEGVMLPVCNHPHHLQSKELSIHGNYEINRVIQVKAQMQWMIRENKTEDDFRKIFGMNFMIYELQARESRWWNEIVFNIQNKRV